FLVICTLRETNCQRGGQSNGRRKSPTSVRHGCLPRQLQIACWMAMDALFRASVTEDTAPEVPRKDDQPATFALTWSAKHGLDLHLHPTLYSNPRIAGPRPATRRGKSWPTPLLLFHCGALRSPRALAQARRRSLPWRSWHSSSSPFSSFRSCASS